MACGCDRKRPAVLETFNPSTTKRVLEKGATHGAGKMWAPLTPIETRAAEHLALRCRGQVNSDAFEERPPRVGHFAAVIVQHNMSISDETVGNANGDTPGHVVVAGPRSSQCVSTAPTMLTARRPLLRHHHQPFQHAANVR